MHTQATLPGAKGGATRKLSFEFLKAVEAESSFETSPMYAIGHEAIYCSGPGEVPLICMPYMSALDVCHWPCGHLL